MLLGGKNHANNKRTAKISCRDDILACAQAIVKRKEKNEFTMTEILECMQSRRTQHPENTIFAHVMSYMCTNAPQQQQVKYHDFRRIDYGIYQINLDD